MPQANDTLETAVRDLLDTTANPSEGLNLKGQKAGQKCFIAHAGQEWFLKTTTADQLFMFESERDALREIAGTHSVRVPEVVCTGSTREYAFIVMQKLELNYRGNAAALGQQLATMHSIRKPYFGWHRDNTIGNTAQPNRRSDNWPEFWKHQRLEFQLHLALENGYHSLEERVGSLVERTACFFKGYDPRPSLVHGDLWSGNHGYLPDGTPVIFDPASHYADRECDLAMSELFGGFDTEFYRAYEAHLPLDEGYAQRKELYQLYHLLNHLNLFGPSWLPQIESVIRRLQREIDP